ncbi:MAG: metallophosphoesterase [Planctomycetes bacterium]|nr:metallophosphoesterase [Planctomycetota bacterium]
MKNKRLLWLGLLIFNLIVIAFLLAVIHVHSDYANTPPNNFIGNNSFHQPINSGGGHPFTFLVIGDSRAKKTSEHLIKLARAKGEPAFMVMNGDFVWRPGIWNHRFFLTRMLNVIKPSFPVFLVPGNHEISDYGNPGDPGMENPERQVTSQVYEMLYGPRNLDFVYNNCLFIICDGSDRSPVNYLDYLRDVLSKKALGKKYIFVFTHYPPKGLDAVIKKACLPDEQEFFALMEQYKVNYCFFGHHHGYWKGERNSTTYIISGGGGTRLEPHIPDKLHHILRMTVGPDKISEEKITSPAQSNLGNWFGETAFTYIFPVIDTNGWALYIILVVFMLDSGMAFFLFRRAAPKPRLDGLKSPE